MINKLQPHKEGIPQYTPLTKQEEKQFNGIPMFGYYKENIFMLEEMYLYRAIFNIYFKNYDAGLKDLNKSWSLHFN